MPKKKTPSFSPKKWLFIGAGIGVGCIVFTIGLKIIQGTFFAHDTQCTSSHFTNTRPPQQLSSDVDYLLMGDYHYDIGDCRQAIDDYTHAIELNPNFPEALNNRAYTYMRLQQYAYALPDLNKALSIRPTYIQALMNRGDIHNFYYQINRPQAIQDYDAVIAQGIDLYKGTSVCGHKMLAVHNGWSIGTVLDLLKHLPTADNKCN